MPALCFTLSDLYSVLNKLEDTPPDTDVELSVDIEIPGVGRRKLLLLDEVSVNVKWVVETE